MIFVDGLCEFLLLNKRSGLIPPFFPGWVFSFLINDGNGFFRRRRSSVEQQDQKAETYADRKEEIPKNQMGLRLDHKAVQPGQPSPNKIDAHAAMNETKEWASKTTFSSRFCNSVRQFASIGTIYKIVQ